MSAAAGSAPAAMELAPTLADVALLPGRLGEHEVVARRYRPRDATIRRALAAADIAAVLAAYCIVLAPAMGWSDLLWTLFVLPGWTVLFKAYGLYEGDIKRVTRGFLADLAAVIHAALVGSVLLWLYIRVTPLQSVGADPLMIFVLTVVTGVSVLRVAARRALRRLLGAERVVIVGDSDAIPLLARKLGTHPEYGMELVGVVSGPEAVGTAELPVLGHAAALDLPRLAHQHRVERVILAGSKAIEGTLADLVRSAHRIGLKVDYLPHPLEVLGAGVEVDDIEGVTVFGLYPPVLPRSSRVVKRIMDIVGAAVALVLTAPVMLAVAIAVKLDSPGPVLFRHNRVGRGGRPVRVVKFRTMVADAEALRATLIAQSRDPHWLLVDDDPRVTRLGRVLRRTSLDELPQLWSVLKGEMSLVGPRPLVEDEDRQITGWGRGRLDLMPGLTGLWQVLGRTSIPFEEMVKLDYVYVTNWSLWGDVKLLLRTLPVLLTQRGAN
jgi:exopolysaccharide biosynthesis polyprenyl glycosylphosphotransferase